MIDGEPVQQILQTLNILLKNIFTKTKYQKMILCLSKQNCFVATLEKLYRGFGLETSKNKHDNVCQHQFEDVYLPKTNSSPLKMDGWNTSF